MLPNAGCICLKLVFCTLRSFNYSAKTFIDKRERGKKKLLYDTPNSYSTIITIIIPQTNHQQSNRSLVTYLDAVGIYVENQRQTFRISVFRDFMLTAVHLLYFRKVFLFNVARAIPENEMHLQKQATNTPIANVLGSVVQMLMKHNLCLI